MRYLVIMETAENPVPMSPADSVRHLETRVLPNHEQSIKLEKEGTIRGGCLVGRRGSAFVVEASSNDELSQLLRAFPLWGLQMVEVTPLESFESRLSRDREALERVKKAV